jgi:hypothetical protein
MFDKMSLEEAKLEKNLSRLKYSIQPKKRFKDFIKGHQDTVFISLSGVVMGKGNTKTMEK